MHAPPSPSRSGRLARFGRAVVAAGTFGGGLLASGVFSSAVPAAPQDCLPVVGCVTTTLPEPPVSLPALPTSTPVTLPTLPVTTAEPDPGTPPTSTTTSAGGTKSTQRSPEATLTAKASIRVLGHGARRVVEIRLRLSKAAHVSALLHRSGRALARRQFAARTGSNILRLKVGRSPKSGAAMLALTYRADSGETARASYRLRLPR